MGTKRVEIISDTDDFNKQAKKICSITEVKTFQALRKSNREKLGS